MPRGFVHDGVDVRTNGFDERGGAAPDEHRCERVRRGSGRRCGAWKVKGSRFCRKHGGHRLGKTRREYDDQPVRVSRLPRFYAKYVSKTLADTLDSLMENSPAEQLQLFAELAVIRDYAWKAVGMYSLVADRYATRDQMSPEDRKSVDEDYAMVTVLMRDGLAEVVKTCKIAADVEAAAKDKVSLVALKYFTDQVTRCAHDAAKKAFAGDPARADQFARDFEELVRGTVRIPKVTGDGELESVDKTPADDVDDMDDTIPGAPDG